MQHYSIFARALNRTFVIHLVRGNLDGDNVHCELRVRWCENYRRVNNNIKLYADKMLQKNIKVKVYETLK